MTSEEQLIVRTRRKIPTRKGGQLRVGMGDDAAVLRLRRTEETVITTDAFLQNVHFLLDVHPPRDVGYKALARATSDIAAMGARPAFFLMNIAVPARLAGKWYDEFLAGIGEATRKFGLRLAGGDTTRYPEFLVNLTILGNAPSGQAVLRSGARPGDLLYVSGRLGAAALGLRLIELKLHRRKQWQGLLQQHFRPEPRLALGQWLRKNHLASAMIDTSDGLSTDLGHLCAASGVGARAWSEEIPSVHVPNQLRKHGIDPTRLALQGGDDYELLFAVPRRRVQLLPSNFRGLELTAIGEITAGQRIQLINGAGQAKLLRPGGWDPFRNFK